MPKTRVLFKLIFWKNITVLKRQRADFNMIYFIWLAIMAFAIYLRGLNISHNSEHEFDIFYTKEESADEVCVPNEDINLVAYSPSSNLLKSILTEICPQATILAFKNFDELDDKIISDFAFTRRLLFAVSFNEEWAGLDSVQNFTTHELTIRLRLPSYHSKRKRHKQDWFTYLLYMNFLPGARNPGEDDDDIPSYHKRGFLYLQETITLAFIKLFKNKTSLNVTIHMQKFPYPDWSGDNFYGHWTEIICPFIIAWPFILKASLILSEITKNKELQITETLKIMGLAKWILWSSTFIYHFVILILFYVSVILIATTVKINRLPILKSADPLIMLLFLAVCACATIAFSFFISTIFSTRIRWHNWWTPAFPGDSLYFGTVLCTLVFDTILFLFLAVYIDTLYPGKYGIRYSWYFPCTSRYWKYHWKCSKKGEVPNQDVEEEDQQKSVKIRNLTMKYGKKTVVDNLDLDLYHGQITVLLGPNGSGKTTTISMISGMIQPSSGSIEIYGYNLHTNFQKVSGLIGVCPQVDVLFEELTVAEHLYFFCVLKGVPKDSVDAEVENYLKLLNLRSMRNILPKHLSVGMKRRLSIAMAICGNSKLIIFDEPTVGLDVLNKRTLWNLLHTVKEGRTVLLITHFLDEAELLGDRIAVLNAGKIECHGTTLSLMQKFGSSYYLTMEVTSKCKPEKVLDFLQSHVPAIELHSFIGTELVYKLPFSARAELGELFKEIEKKLKQLHIQGFGISPASLQEIFSRQASTFFLDLNKRKKRTSVSSSATQSRSQELYKEKSIQFMKSGTALIRNQMRAVFVKKLIYMKQSWLLHLMTQLIIPVIILFVKLYPKFLYFSEKQAPLNISLDSYVDPVTLVGGKNTEFIQIYQEMLSKYKTEKVSDMTKEILSKTKASFMDVRLHYIVGAFFENGRSVAWFNSMPLHSPPLALGLVLNTVFKKYLGEEYSVAYVNDPLPLEAGESVYKSPISFLPATMVFVMLSIVISIIPNYIIERENGAKNLQYTAGLHPLVYWGVSFGFDFTLFTISTIVAIGTAVFITAGEIVQAPEQIQILILTMFLYGLYQILWIYFLSFKLNSPAAGVSYIFNFGVIIGLLGHYFLEELDDFAIVHYAYMVIIPFFPLFASLVNAQTIYKQRKNCLQIGTLEAACEEEHMCCETDYFVMNDKAIGLFVTFCFVMSVLIVFYLLLIKELSFFREYFENEQPPDFDVALEPDVRKEVSLIHNTDINKLNESYILLLKDLTKYYKGEHGGHGVLAVNGVCLGVKPYECFGLLGSNGAGKTTVFKMITGHTSISFGDVWVNGFNVNTEMRKVQKNVGYCPQSNALFEQFSSYGILKYYCMIHGIATKMIDEIIDYYAETFHFSHHLKKKVAHLSEGNKRKLSTVIALLGNPKIILLDEPTSGVDPIVKREMWNVIAAMRSIGKSIVLTSHNMEDSEALCTRMAIMARGTFQCLGSKQELKNKFAEGYYVRVKMNANATSEDVKAVINFVKTGFLGAKVLEQCQQLLVFKLPDVSLPCSRLFTTFEKNKKSFNFDEFSIEMCNLEEVFLNFTKGISFLQSQDSSSSLTNLDPA